MKAGFDSPWGRHFRSIGLSVERSFAIALGPVRLWYAAPLYGSLVQRLVPLPFKETDLG